MQTRTLKNVRLTGVIRHGRKIDITFPELKVRPTERTLEVALNRARKELKLTASEFHNILFPIAHTPIQAACKLSKKDQEAARRALHMALDLTEKEQRQRRANKTGVAQRILDAVTFDNIHRNVCNDAARNSVIMSTIRRVRKIIRAEGGLNL